MIRLFDVLDTIDKAITDRIDIPYTNKVKDNGDTYSLKIDIPGFEKEEIDSNIVDNVLSIKAKNAEDSRSFAFYIPRDIVKDTIVASLKNGQLTITLPKKVQVPTTNKIRII